MFLSILILESIPFFNHGGSVTVLIDCESFFPLSCLKTPTLCVLTVSKDGHVMSTSVDLAILQHLSISTGMNAYTNRRLLIVVAVALNTHILQSLVSRTTTQQTA